MNILHIKYAVEVANAGSINKASEILLIAQPNLSRSIKELETDLGISIFDRSSKGMVLTPEGEEFIGYANKILSLMDYVEQMYKKGLPSKQKFSVSVPRASYISDAFAKFSCSINANPSEIFYNETNSQNAIQNILNADYKLGIIRYAANYDKYFKAMLDEKDLSYELIGEFHYLLAINKNSPLANKENICFSDLSELIEIAHADPFVPSLPLSVVKKEELPDNIKHRIFVFERASQFDLLSENKNTFMWVSPLPDNILKRYNLIQRECFENKKLYRDMLIHRKNYKLTELDNLFITEVCNSRRRYF
ncbi:MAG: LysR family transcriptional regulator [Oscillospiraceae bacterium]